MRNAKTSGRREVGEGWSLTTDPEPARGPSAPNTADDGSPQARLRLEKRRGKPVTVITLQGLDAAAQRTLGKELKTRCGSGGTVKESSVELQGDHREALRALLPQRGLGVKG